MDDIFEEDYIKRGVILSAQYAGKKKYPAIPNIRDHGWKNENELAYSIILEKPFHNLEEVA